MYTLMGVQAFYAASSLMIVFLVSEVLCLSPPSYISQWIFMDADDPTTTFQTFTHGFGVLPIKAEVQVMSPTTGFVYPGVNSAYGGNDDNSRGGVICIYNENDVRLYGATNENTESGKAYIIFTGSVSWTPDNQEISTTGYVRVRVWHPNDLPAPDFTSSGHNMKANGNPWPNYVEVNHGLGVVPVLTVVQYLPAFSVPLSGWTSEGQGSSSRRLDDTNLYWGGLVYGVSDSSVRFWTASSGDANYAIFSFCDGWGYDVRGSAASTMSSDCSYIRAYITVHMWTNLGTTESYSHSEVHDTSDTLVHEHSLHPLHSIDLDADILTLTTEATSGTDGGFHFPGTGSAMVDDASGCGGVIYAYSNSTSSVRFWHPTTRSPKSGITHVERMGSGSNNQLSSDGNIIINLFKPSTSVINNCLGIVADPGVNANVTLSPGTGSLCVVDYTCYNGHSLVSGDLQLFYDINTGLWTGSPAECQAGPPPMQSFWFAEVGPNTNVNITDTSGGFLAEYECQTGYSYIQGDFLLLYNQSVGLWNGTALECQIICPNPPAGVNSKFVMSSAVTIIGTVANYSCFPGNERSSGDYLRVCHGNGDWTGSVLNCTALMTTSTTVAMPTTTDNSYATVCFNATTVINITTILEVAAEIVANLTVDTKTTSKHLRSLVSAHDSRQSSKLIGMFGAIVCSLVLGLMVVPDLISAVRFLCSVCKTDKEKY